MGLEKILGLSNPGRHLFEPQVPPNDSRIQKIFDVLALAIGGNVLAALFPAAVFCDGAGIDGCKLFVTHRR